ncbi:Flagellar hook capping protein FlgD [uncultured Desulfatiglans sp.]|nr:Flagellar hook capping protein FlgD [uncultured Desulfatiglans sp.]
MSIAAVNSSIMGTASTEKLANEGLEKDDFLRLLVTQLQYQDPLNPMDSTEFTAQLAQFSSLEQMNNLNKQMEYLLMYQSSINNSQSVDFIGKEIQAAINAFEVNNSEISKLSYAIDSDVSIVTVNIYAEDGNLLRSLNQGAANAGKHEIDWDGKDANGNTVPDGIYTFEVKAVDNKGNDVQTKNFVSGQVTGITFEEGTTYLLLGGLKVPVGAVVEILSAQELEG